MSNKFRLLLKGLLKNDKIEIYKLLLQLLNILVTLCK